MSARFLTARVKQTTEAALITCQMVENALKPSADSQ
jgi:hypothetical protein